MSLWNFAANIGKTPITIFKKNLLKRKMRPRLYIHKILTIKM